IRGSEASSGLGCQVSSSPVNRMLAVSVWPWPSQQSPNGSRILWMLFGLMSVAKGFSRMAKLGAQLGLMRTPGAGSLLPISGRGDLEAVPMPDAQVEPRTQE